MGRICGPNHQLCSLMEVTPVLMGTPWSMGASLPMANGPGRRPSRGLRGESSEQSD